MSQPTMPPAAPPLAQQEPVMNAPAAQPSSETTTGWAGINVQVTGADVPAGAAQNAVLFVMIRTPGVAAGPPIGVRRIIGPSLPLEITISDRDSMLQERQISSEAQLQIQARLSLSGSPGARSGDWQSEPVIVSLESAESVELIINQQVE
jgi:cytochrome c-type biogenesis protein CcmH